MEKPSAGLAPTVAAETVDTIEALNRRSMTMPLVEQAVAAYTNVLKNGKLLVFSGQAAGPR